ncbi:MAG: helix-turn-helix transcriptional regulator [Gammaproteobacteria bacterium]|nr:helix-turn-helix transcriptional regulator [Gammaproteobacteria bacterium]
MARHTTTAGVDAQAVAAARKLLTKERRALPRMADLYKLLANPARLKILLVLSRTEQMCVSDLAAVLELSIAATSHQLKLLKDRGWLRGKGDGKLIYYSLANEGLKDALEGDLRLLSEAASP